MKTILIFLALVFSILSYAQEPFDFRKTNWGWTKDQVKKSEIPKILNEESSVIAYNGKLAGYPCIIGYIFTNNILVRAKYIIMESRINSSNYDSDYNTFKDFLTKKYGQPLKDEKNWIDNTFKDSYSYWGNAISYGHVDYITFWETESTFIFLSFLVQNGDVSIAIEYTSKKYRDLEQENILKDF